MLLALWAASYLPSVDSFIKSSSLSSAISEPIASLASVASSKISGLLYSPDEKLSLESINNEMYRTKVEEALNSFKEEFDTKIQENYSCIKDRDEQKARFKQAGKTSSDDLIADQLAQVTQTCCQTEEELKALIEKHMKSFLESFRQSYSGTFDEDKMKKMISDALILYDADKTRQPEFVSCLAPVLCILMMSLLWVTLARRYRELHNQMIDLKEKWSQTEADVKALSDIYNHQNCGLF